MSGRSGNSLPHRGGSSDSTGASRVKHQVPGVGLSSASDRTSRQNAPEHVSYTANGHPVTPVASKKPNIGQDPLSPSGSHSSSSRGSQRSSQGSHHSAQGSHHGSQGSHHGSHGTAEDHGKIPSLKVASPPKIGPRDKESQETAISSIRYESSTGTRANGASLAPQMQTAAYAKPGTTKPLTEGVVLPMVYARQLKQTMSNKTRLFCYSFKFTGPGMDGNVDSKDSKHKVKVFMSGELAGFPSHILSDYLTYLISTVRLPTNLLSVSHGDSGIILEANGDVTWSQVLQFLNTAKLSATLASKDEKAMLCVFNVLLAQSYSSKDCGSAQGKPFTALDIEYRKPDNEAPKEKALLDVIKEFAASGQISGQIELRRLETCLQGHRVRIEEPHDGKAASTKDRMRTITGLARPDDGSDCKKSQRCEVARYGANSHEVRFYFKSKAKDRKRCSLPIERLKNQHITVAEYFANIQKSKKALTWADLPVVNVGTRRKPTYIPAERCTLVDYRRNTVSKMDHNDLAEIARAVDPHKLLQNCSIRREAQVAGLKRSPQGDKIDCNIGITAASMLTPCRLLSKPEIAFTDIKGVATSTSQKSGSRSHKVALLRINPSPWATDEKMQETCQALEDLFNNCALTTECSTADKSITLKNKNYTDATLMEIKTELEKLNEYFAIITVIPAKNQRLYEYLKRQCDVNLGLQNVCVIEHKLETATKTVTGTETEAETKKEFNSYLAKAVLKINLKAGGQNKYVKLGSLGSNELNATMIVGFGTIAPPPGALNKAQGVAAMVASTDHTLSQWPSSIMVVGNRTSYDGLADLLMERLVYWKSKNKNKRASIPDNIILYCNGSSTEADAKILAAELSKFEEKCRSKHKNQYTPKMTVIAVAKDHHAQLRTLDSIEATEERIPNGTIVVRTSEVSNKWEFVMQGYQPPKDAGTKEGPLTHEASRATPPVRYKILSDDIFLPKEKLENLTHELCYLSGYGGFPLTDSLPIHYVGLLLERVQMYLRSWYHPTEKLKHAEEARFGPTEETTKEMKGIVQPHADIKDTMFYV